MMHLFQFSQCIFCHSFSFLFAFFFFLNKSFGLFYLAKQDYIYIYIWAQLLFSFFSWAQLLNAQISINLTMLLCLVCKYASSVYHLSIMIGNYFCQDICVSHVRIICHYFMLLVNHLTKHTLLVIGQFQNVFKYFKKQSFKIKC